MLRVFHGISVQKCFEKVQVSVGGFNCVPWDFWDVPGGSSGLTGAGSYRSVQGISRVFRGISGSFRVVAESLVVLGRSRGG